MRIRRLLQGTAVAALSVIAWSGAGAADASASIGISAVNVDTETQQIIVTPNAGDKEVLFSIAKKGSKSGKTVFKMSSWDIYDTNGGAVKMDLSKLNATKENFIAVMTGDMDKPFIIKIPASDKVNVLTYNAQNHELEFKSGNSKGDAIAATSFEYMVPGGKWSSKQDLEKGMVKDIFKEYQYQGASLYVRTCAVNENELKPDSYYSNVYDASNIDNKLDVYVSGKLPGKISKLNIAKQANGPSVSVQYTDGTLTLPKAAEYRVLVEGADGSYSFKEFTDEANDGEAAQDKTTIVSTDDTKATTGVKTDTLLGTSASPATSGTTGILEVRTKAKSNSASPARAKCASKWTRINIEVAAPLTDEELGGADVIAAACVTSTAVSGGAGIKNAVVRNKDGKDVVSVDYGASKEDGGVWKGVIRFTNIGDDEYQIIASKEPVDDVTELTTGAKVLAAGSTSTKIVNLTDVEDGSYIYIRKAGNQSKKKWAGVYRLFGRADIPKN